MKTWVVIAAAAATALFTVSVFMLSGKTEVKYDKAGMELFGVKRYDDAMRTWREGLERDPKSFRLHYRLGTTLAVLGRFDEAQVEFDTVLSQEPRHAPTLFEMAMMYLRQSRVEEARGALERTVACAEWYPDAHYWLGWIKERQGKTDEAQALYVRELNLNPWSTLAWAKVFGKKEAGFGDTSSAPGVGEDKVEGGGVRQ